MMSRARYLVASLFLIPVCVSAHPGHELTYSMLSGLRHPVVGLDHLLATLAVGFWSAQQSDRQRWVLPISFILALLVGALWAGLDFVVPSIEPGIALSLLILGFLVSNTKRLSLLPAVILISVFALLHGYAHGSQMPALADESGYVLGFLLSTVGLLALGAKGAKWLMLKTERQVAPWLGAMIYMYGLTLLS